MSVRTKRLGNYQGPVTTGQTSYFTCPAGRTAILKTLLLQADNGTTGTLIASVRTGGVTYQVARQALTGPDVARLTGLHVVLEPGDELTVAGGAALAGVRIHASGTLLLGSPT